MLFRSGLDRPSGGEVRLAGSRVDQMSERALARLRQDAVGFVFQAFHLMDELTAVENVELPALLAQLDQVRTRGYAQTQEELEDGLNAVAAFWIAYILTRPLGASFRSGGCQPSGLLAQTQFARARVGQGLNAG